MSLKNRIEKLERQVQAKIVAAAEYEKPPAGELENLLGDPNDVSADLIEVSANSITILAANMLTVEEMAGFFRINLSAMKQHLSDPDLREAYMRGRAKGMVFLREEQQKLADDGNVQMLIWLGKQRLGQTNTPTGKTPWDDGLPEADDQNFVSIPWTPEMQAEFYAIDDKFSELRELDDEND